MSESILHLIILLPLLGATAIGLLGFLMPDFRKAEQAIGAVATLMVAIPFVLILITLFGYHHEPVHFTLFPWMVAGNINISFAYTLDELSLLMGLVVTGVGSLIHIYSIGYMHGDKGYYKFFLYLNLFIFAMLNLILGDNMAVMFLGWEGVGACSYFLIGFWYEDMVKAMAAQKAFIANRIGDFCMLVAMFMIFDTVGSLQFDEIINFSWAGNDHAGWIALLLFGAATGKSAQIPLFVWLPDAMAGPTPVSALIHAATMVTSGIYLIARLSELFLASPMVMSFVCLIGAATAIMAALIAIAQNDIKKVLAYSTVSQLGFMFMALGAGAFTTAIFHVMTHAFFKACLFLGSGSVIHAMAHMNSVKDPQDIRTMGGLKKYMPSTRWTFFISTLAIAGIPLLSGFFSKDEIMSKVFAMGSENALYWFIWVVGMTTAALTAFYMMRVYWLTFEGEERFPDKHHPHESPATMTLPLWILAGLAVVGGYVGIPAVFAHGKLHFLNHWLEGAVNLEHIEGIVEHNVSHTLEYFLIGFSILIAVGGVFASYKLFSTHTLEGDEMIKTRLGKMYTWMQDKFYVDELYENVIIKPFIAIGRDLVMGFDKNVLDAIVNGTGSIILFSGDLFKRLQTGLVSHYALLLFIGVISILSYLVFG